eukprot:scaffold200511_cov29-Tisochrysis_lutea.AAC.6
MAPAAAIDPLRQAPHLEQRDVVREQLLVGEVKRVADELVDMVVGENVVDGGPGLNVGDEDGERLEYLHLDAARRLPPFEQPPELA